MLASNTLNQPRNLPSPKPTPAEASPRLCTTRSAISISLLVSVLRKLDKRICGLTGSTVADG
jgi:hypothetical protein